MIKSDIQYSNKLHLFFALVIVATTFTKLRGSEEHFLIPFIHSSIGPMDILFVLTILALSPFRLNKLFFTYVFYFLLVTVVTMSANLFINVYMADGNDVLHDIMALLANILFLSVLINNDKISFSNLLNALYVITSLYLLAMFISGVLLKQGFFYWEYNIQNQRLSGLARNPNQISLLVYLLSGLSLYFFDTAVKTKMRILHLLVFFLSLIIAAYVNSDALTLGIIALILFATFFRTPMILVYVMLTISISILLIIIFVNIEYLENTLSSSFQVQERLARWLSFEYLFPQVFFLGFGPGGHGPSFDDSFQYIVGIPLQNTEFHNSFLDFFSQYGILFTLFVLLHYLYCLLKINDRRLHMLIALALGAFVICFFHMYTRQPLFWLLILMPFIYKYKENHKCVE